MVFLSKKNLIQRNDASLTHTMLVCLPRDRMRLQKKFQKQFGVRQKWDQKSQVIFLLSDGKIVSVVMLKPSLLKYKTMSSMHS